MTFRFKFYSTYAKFATMFHFKEIKTLNYFVKNLCGYHDTNGDA